MENNQIAEVMQQALQTVESLQKALQELRPLADFGAAVIDDGRHYSFNDELDDDSRRIEACYNIIKVCKGIANDLQAGRK